MQLCCCCRDRIKRVTKFCEYDDIACVAWYLLHNISSYAECNQIFKSFLKFDNSGKIDLLTPLGIHAALLHYNFHRNHQAGIIFIFDLFVTTGSSFAYSSTGSIILKKELFHTFFLRSVRRGLLVLAILHRPVYVPCDTLRQ